MRIGLSILFVVSVAGMPQAAALGADSDKPVQPATVTFSKDVAPILERSCQTCHRQGEVTHVPSTIARSAFRPTQPRGREPFFADGT